MKNTQDKQSLWKKLGSLLLEEKRIKKEIRKILKEFNGETQCQKK